MRVHHEKLRTVLTQKSGQEGWTDAEIGKLLGLSTSTIFQWRRKFGIARAKKFRKNFARIYGAESLAQLENLVANHATLTQISTTFGFTREYARIVKKQLGAAQGETP